MGPTHIPASRAEDTKFTGNAAEVAAREHRRKILELTKATFPDGVPMRYTGPTHISTSQAEDTKFTGNATEVAARERRRKILELAKAAFPDGVPMPYFLTPARHQQDYLPFIQASLRISKDDADDTLCDFYSDVWCLWDTGAFCTTIPSHYLRHEVTGGHETGFANLSIIFTRTQKEIQTTITFRPSQDIPNQTNFIILGQQGLIAGIRYEVTPATHDPNNTDELAYGVLDLKSYYDPVELAVSPFNV
jgi:hypothetical protein